MALLVALDDRWLVDVGFGDSFLEPMAFVLDSEQAQGRRSYRLESHDSRFFVTRRDGDGPWVPQYRFDLTPYEYADYAEMCRYHQTSPDSHFTRSRICSLATPEGRVTISGSRLIVTTDEWRREWEMAGEFELADTLRERFGIVI